MVADLVAQQGGVVAGAGADLQHTVAGVEVETFQHERHQRGSGGAGGSGAASVELGEQGDVAVDGGQRGLTIAGEVVVGVPAGGRVVHGESVDERLSGDGEERFLPARFVEEPVGDQTGDELGAQRGAVGGCGGHVWSPFNSSASAEAMSSATQESHAHWPLALVSRYTHWPVSASMTKSCAA